MRLAWELTEEMISTNCMIKRSCKSEETASDSLEKEKAAQLNLQER